jgi:hypothetical protein
MIRRDRLPSIARLSDDDRHDSNRHDSEADLLRPCLRRAFPLPENGHDSDERFRQLLDDLARRVPRGRRHLDLG